MRVDDADLLDEVLAETVDYSADLKALVLRMIHQQQGQLETVAQQTGLPLSTLYHWLKQWNEQQRATKKTINYPARARRGSPIRVKESIWQAWRQALQTQSEQHWTSPQLAQHFESLSGVRYSHSHWCWLLREQEGMYFYKPRPQDYRRDEQAEEKLAQRIEATFDALQAMGYALDRVG